MPHSTRRPRVRLPESAAGRYRLVVDWVSAKRADVGLYAAGGRCVLLAGAGDVHRDQLDATVARLVREADACLGERCPASGPAAPAG